MKKSSDLPVDEAATAFNDPPNILVLRRKAIRMFPHGQSVATYRNDNFNIDLAIPYTPGTLGKKSVVATSEGVQKSMAAALEEMRDLRKDSQDINAGLGNRYSHLRVKENPKAHKANSSYAAWTVHGKNEGDKKGKAIATLVHKSGTKFEETVYEAMSDELKKIRKDRGMFKRDMSRQEDRFETAKQRLDWAKKALAGHIKKHGKSLDAIGEELVCMVENASHDEMLFGNYLHKPEAHIERTVINKYGDKALHHFMRAAAHYSEGDHETANHHFQKYKQAASVVREETDDTIMEATIHSLHTIMKTQHPAKIRFRDGSSAMIDHPTAHQIMNLHSKVNRLNKKKIEGLINSGPMGIRKVSAFIKDHVKQ